jgi:RNA polymerase sigma-70 factor (ECF subfamily)
MNEKRTEKGVEMMAAAPVPGTSGNLEEAFRAHHARVFRAAYRVTGSEADAEDVLQTVFLRLVRQGRAMESIASLENYLCRAAVNAALDLVRNRKAAAIPLEVVAAVVPDNPTLRPDRRQAAGELRQFLRRAVAALSPKAAEMFTLRYFEGYGNIEIAEITGSTQNEVAVTLHRTRNRLQEEIRSYMGDKS